jgi:hypothetical protein
MGAAAERPRCQRQKRAGSDLPALFFVMPNDCRLDTGLGYNLRIQERRTNFDREAKEQ